MDFLLSLLGRNGFLPHGYCFTWSPGLLWSMVASDAVIAAAYFSIPVAMLSYVRQRRETTNNGMAWLFSGFIFACGLTHVMGIWTVWQPAYGLQAITKVVTAAISLVTAVALWPLIPRALKIPSVGQLQAVIGSLEAEIGKRRSAEEQLSATQQSLAVTLASIDAGFIATDRAGRVTHMNAVAEAVTGWPQADALGVPLLQVFEREGRPAEYHGANPVDLMQAQRITIETVTRLACIARDGRRTPLEVKADLTRSHGGLLTGMAMVFRDMSRLLQAEADAKRLVAIVESSSDAIIGMTLDGHITSWNRAAQAMFGHTAEQAVGQPIQLLVPPDHLSEEQQLLARLARGEAVPAFDTVRLTRSGERLDVSLTVSPIKDDAGQVVGASKIARDVSNQRRAERALRESERRLRFTLDAARIGDWELALPGGAMQHSSRFARCFGHAELPASWGIEQLLGQLLADDRDAARQSLEHAVSEGRDWRMETRVVWPDGSLHWLAIHGSIQRDDAAGTRLLGIVSNITEQRLAESARLTAQRLEAENRQIQEANRLKSQFLANMSHELRTPLNAVIGFADLLHAGFIKPDSPKHQQFLGHIGTSGRHLLQLINDVLDLSKVESGKFDFYPEVVDLHALLKEVRDILHTAIVTKDTRLVIDIDASLGDLHLDPARLKQVLYNYLSNAIKFTGAKGLVRVRVSPQGAAHFRIEVEDNGSGISAADLPRLFTEFQQLDTGYSKQHQGTGLGLALTRRLVEAQGGQVGVRSTPGVGSVFFVVLNRRHGVDGEPAAAAAGHTGPGAARRLLAIEGNPQQSARIVQALSVDGLHVDAGTDSDSALRRARETAYAAITLQLQLPDRRGLELLSDIRAQGASVGSPVLGVTLPAGEQASAAFAIANVLCKPIRSDEILAAVAHIQRGVAGQSRVMVIDDDPASLDLMQATLSSIGVDAVCFADGRTALGEIDNVRPDAIVLDLMMPGFDGFQVLDVLQQSPALREVPVFIWTSMLLTDGEYAALAQSARAIVLKGGGAIEAMLDSIRRWSPPALNPATKDTTT